MGWFEGKPKGNTTVLEDKPRFRVGLLRNQKETPPYWRTNAFMVGFKGTPKGNAAILEERLLFGWTNNCKTHPGRTKGHWLGSCRNRSAPE